ncbi:MAG: GatB/YqeY domain-containing protein [Flavobacteriales bacterium]|nr:GatB/YqeY domain-containing protein [Flavobacteriales bacterium]
MSLKAQIMPAMKEAMKAKDKVTLETLRAIKAELLTAETATGASGEMSEAEEIKLLQKMQKQRKDAAAIYVEQGRADLAADETAQTKVLEKFLPEQMSAEELEKAVAAIINKLGASGPADMGKVMGVASKELAGKAEGRLIADTVKALLIS